MGSEWGVSELMRSKRYLNGVADAIVKLICWSRRWGVWTWNWISKLLILVCLDTYWRVCSILTSNPVITIQHITSVTVMHTTCKFILLSFRCDFSPVPNAMLLSVGLRCDNLWFDVDSLTAPLQLLLIDFWSWVASISSANGAVGYGEFDVGMDAGIGPQFMFFFSLLLRFAHTRCRISHTHFRFCTLFSLISFSWQIKLFRFRSKWLNSLIQLSIVNTFVFHSPIKIN